MGWPDIHGLNEANRSREQQLLSENCSGRKSRQAVHPSAVESSWYTAYSCTVLVRPNWVTCASPKGGPHRVSKKSADFRCRKRTLWTWRGAAPIVIERSENVETLPLYIAKVEGCKGANFFQGRKQNLYSFLFTLSKVAPLHPNFSLSIFLDPK